MRDPNKIVLNPDEPTKIVHTAEELGLDGLALLEDFITENEEEHLVRCTDEEPEERWTTLARTKRRVLHMGYAFDYDRKTADEKSRIGDGKLPVYMQGIIERMGDVPEIQEAIAAEDSSLPVQCTVNDYPRGAGMAPHIDTHSAFSGALVSLTCSGHTVMEFRKQVDGITTDKRAIVLPRRSLLVLAGVARYAWKHYIPIRKNDVIDGQLVRRPLRRVSYTFRSLRTNGPCKCAFPEHCDSQSATYFAASS
mmetsp:Transcript_2876/g.10407  ORF Transcript_2876/g.10407 Transcript_2876/m.10407 type:complete len:251 (+) Transcript_2876:167-919(+)